jgi:hypothetical protein
VDFSPYAGAAEAALVNEDQGRTLVKRTNLHVKALRLLLTNVGDSTLDESRVLVMIDDADNAKWSSVREDRSNAHGSTTIFP